MSVLRYSRRFLWPFRKVCPYLIICVTVITLLILLLHHKATLRSGPDSQQGRGYIGAQIKGDLQAGLSVRWSDQDPHQMHVLKRDKQQRAYKDMVKNSVIRVKTLQSQAGQQMQNKPDIFRYSYKQDNVMNHQEQKEQDILLENSNPIVSPNLYINEGQGVEHVVYNITPAPIDTKLKFKPFHNTKLYRSRNRTVEKFQEWYNTKIEFCDGRFQGFDNNFAMLHQVVLDREHITGRSGGEDIMSVINQPEESEYFIYTLGAFQMVCKDREEYYFQGENNHLTEWLLNTKTNKVKPNDPVAQTKNRLTIALTRYEYVNFYHTMTDFYNAFIMMEYFNATQSSTGVVFFDGHPKGGLDLTWRVLFRTADRLGSLKQRTRFKKLVWAPQGYRSVLEDHDSDEPPPLLKEFRQFFLQSHHVNDTREMNCTNPSFTIVWRRDYVAHPRNPSGHITRKIDNERELITELRKHYRNATIRGVQIERYDMQQQLQMIADTDMLIGMHGAGLSHALFLPQHAAVLEFVPSYWSQANIHFEAFSRWRGLLYDKWVNEDFENEHDGGFTKVPPAAAVALVRNLLTQMCSDGTRDPLARWRHDSADQDTTEQQDLSQVLDVA